MNLIRVYSSVVYYKLQNWTILSDYLSFHLCSFKEQCLHKLLCYSVNYLVCLLNDILTSVLWFTLTTLTLVLGLHTQSYVATHHNYTQVS